MHQPRVHVSARYLGEAELGERVQLEVGVARLHALLEGRPGMPGRRHRIAEALGAGELEPPLIRPGGDGRE
jgi:hypothetical protein